MNTNKNKRSKLKLAALYTVLILGVGIMTFFAIALLTDIFTTRKGQSYYSTVAIDYIPRSTQVPVQQPSVTYHDTNTADTPNAPNAPDIPFLDFDALREEFPNIVGWIQSEGTPINYPIVQGTDNDFYLSHLPNEKRNKLGSIYMDFRNSADFTNVITKIYGHNTRAGDMFGTLSQYEHQRFFEQHSSMLIFTPHQNYKLVLFAGYILDSAFEVPPMNFPNEDDFYKFIADIKSRSIFTSDIEVNYGDRLILLCTCTTLGASSKRLIIVAKLTNI